MVREIGALQDVSDTPVDPGVANQVLRKELGMELAWDRLTRPQGHALHILQVAKKFDDEGRSFVEVRLNCCGHPVLMVLAEPSAGGWPIPLRDLPFDEEPAEELHGDVRLVMRDLDRVRVAVSSTHPVAHIATAVIFGT